MPTDEHWTMPPEWHDLVLPRRSNTVRPRLRPNPRALARVRGEIEKFRDDILFSLNKSGNDPDLAAAGRAYLCGSPDLTGEAVAMLLAARCHTIGLDIEDYPEPTLSTLDLCSALLIEHSLPIAVATVVEILRVKLFYDPPGIAPVGKHPLVGRADSIGSDVVAWNEGNEAIRLVRSMIADCSEEEYSAVVAEVEHHRDTVMKRVGSTHLLPDQDDWVRLACADPIAHRHRTLGTDVLLTMASDVEHLELAGWATFDRYTCKPAAVAELVTHLGTRSFPFLVESLETPNLLAESKRAVLVEGIAAIGSEEADEYLHTHYGRHLASADELAIPVAAPSQVPLLLTSPPWTRKRGRAIEIKGLRPSGEVRLAWAEGERERWTAPETPYHAWEENELWDGVQQSIDNYYSSRLTLDMVRAALIRFGPDMSDRVLRVIRDAPPLWPALVPIESPAAARLAADWLVRLKVGGRIAVEWLDRHGERGAMLLVPEALRKLGKRRRNAETALLYLGRRIGSEPVVRAAATYGPEAAVAIEILLQADPADPWTRRLPGHSRWYAPKSLPPLLTADGRFRLSDEAVARAVEVMRLWSPHDDYPGADILSAYCEPDSLERLSLAVFEQWTSLGAPGRHSWAVVQLARFGGRAAAGRLVSEMDRWHREGRQAQVEEVLRVLVHTGSEESLQAMYTSSHSEGHAASRAARRAFDRAAARRDLEPEQLADRAFSAPAPANAVVEDLAVEQASRLERAMRGARVWSAEEFERFVLTDTVVRDLARRLLWAHRIDGRWRAFRIAEDNSFADVREMTCEVPADGSVRLAHPALLGEDLTAWVERFVDYRILQPFDQLSRPPMAFIAAEAETGVLGRFEGAAFVGERLFKILDFDWRASSPAEVDRRKRRPTLWRPIPGGYLLAEHHESLSVTDLRRVHRLTVGRVWLARTQNYRAESIEPLPGRQLDPAIAAEILAGLTDARIDH